MTPAEELRKAAATIRERAEGAEPGPWTVRVKSYSSDSGPYEAAEIPRVAEESWCAEEGPSAPLEVADATHIATWSPPVAFAVAAWLEVTAEGVEVADAIASARGFVTHHPRTGEEWTLARLINGSAP